MLDLVHGLDNIMPCLLGSQAQDVLKKVANYVVVTLFYIVLLPPFMSHCLIITCESCLLGHGNHRIRFGFKTQVQACQLIIIILFHK